jgi:ABC-type molybdate transport system substrate-binding protein
MNKAIRLFLILFIIGVVYFVFFAGGGNKTTLKIYCDELFWSVIWEEAAQFQRVYGKQVELLRNYPVDQVHEDDNKEHDSVKKSYVPSTWRNMPKDARDNENNNKPKITLNSHVTKIIFDLRETLPGDMYLTESVLQTAALNEQSLVTSEYPFCYLTMVLLVPNGNPNFIDSVRDAIDRQLRLGIMEPSITGMGSTAWDIITKINEAKTTPKDNNTENENIKIYDSIEKLLDALEQNQIDAALTWDACARRAEKYAEVIRLGKKNININNANNSNANNANNTNSSTLSESVTLEKPAGSTIAADELSDIQGEHRLVRVSIVSLTIAERESHCRRFADFLISTEGQRILRRHGFVPIEK